MTRLTKARVEFYSNKNTTESVSNMPSKYEAKNSTEASIKVKVGAAPKRNGYKFVTWNLKSNNSGTKFAPGTEITLDRTTPKKTLYAIWEAASTNYTINYDAAGGSNAPSGMGLTANISVTFTVSSTEPTRAGYVFKGWKFSADNKTYQKNASVTLYADPSKATKTVTFTAQWEKTPVTYKIEFNGNGSGSGNIPAAVVKENVKEASCDLVIPNVTPTRSG